jgi:hypothetical protein
MSARAKSPVVTSAPVLLLGEIRQLIDAARQRAATAVNSELTLLYWRIGERIHTQVLAGRRAEYGEEIVATLSQQLMNDYGKGFGYTALTRMVNFYEAFPDEKIVATLSQQLSWSHFREILPLKRPLQREYYAEMCRVERWSVRTLRERIDSMLYPHLPSVGLTKGSNGSGRMRGHGARGQDWNPS